MVEGPGGERESALERAIDHHLDLRKGAGGDAPFHGLIELGPEAVPVLRRRFLSETDPGCRVLLLEAIREHRLRSSIPLFERTLDDPDPAVWKAALDGLVSTGRAAALAALERQREGASGERREWIEEAVGQVREGLEAGAAGEDERP